MRKRSLFVIGALGVLVHACNVPILNPPVSPGQCANNEHTCSDGGCCLDGWECTTDRPYLPDPPGHGYCEDAMGKKLGARRP